MAVQVASTPAVFDAAGTATAQVGPVPVGQTWRITRTSVQSSSSTRTTATVYRNSPLPGNFIDQTRAGGNSDSTDTVYRLRSGESVVVQWTGGSVGAKASFDIEGEPE